MLVAHLSNPRKRRNLEQLTPLPDETQHVPKKLKHTHITDPQYPPAFWDNLSKVDLTKRALKELDRRKKEVASSSHTSDRQPRRPITRRTRATLKDCQPPNTATYFLDHCGARALKKINQFARHGGPDLSHLRNFSNPIDPLDQAMSRSQSSSRARIRESASASNSQSTTTTKSTGPYNRNFQQNLIDSGVYPDGYEYPNGQVPVQPANLHEINQCLSQPRPSLSPSRFTDEDFRNFKRADTHASKEKQVTASVVPIIEGDIGDPKCVSGGIPFTNLDHLTDGTLVPGNPDIYYGARPERLDRRVRDELSGHIIPSTQDDLPIVPNCFLAIKGPDGSAAVAKRQAIYDGALGARGMHTLQSYGQDNPVYNNNAYTVTAIYHDGTLKLFTSHPTQPVVLGGRPEYHMHQLRSFAMGDTAETFRQGATYYRNAREWAREQRDETITRANERVGEREPGKPAVDSSFASEGTLDGTSTIAALSQESQALSTEDSTTTVALQESVTSSEEFSPNHRLPVKRSNRNSKSLQSQRKRRIAAESD